MDLSEKGASSTRHPWEAARAAFFVRLLAEHGLLDDGSWLDAGAGDAWFARQLRDRLPHSARITCWDVNYTADDIDALAGLDVENVEYVSVRPASRFDRVLMLDVIEHVEDDEGFVSGVVEELLRPEGFALVSVPAYESLWSSHDRALSHQRRYSPGTCRELLERAGLEVISSGGLFLSLLPAAVGRRFADRVRPERSGDAGIGDWSGGRLLTRSLTSALVLDGRVSLALSKRGRSVPGLSFWALCTPSAA